MAMRAPRLPCRVDWARYRTMGIDLVVVGVLILVISSGFAFYSVCPNPGICYTEVDWPTLSPAIALIVVGVFVLIMALLQKRRGE